MEERFWEPDAHLYADEATPDWHVSAYRGQNANMHAVEAHMAAWDATRDAKHLARARAIAHAMCVRQAARVEAATGHALVYEHYDAAWNVDLEFNRDKPGDRFLPYGFQPGHLLEWAKLLMQLHERRDAGGGEAEAESGWRPAVAARFFRAALRGWDESHGGLVYSMLPTKELPFCNVRRGGSARARRLRSGPLTLSPPSFSPSQAEKYKWPTAEGIAAAALLARHSEGEERRFFLEWYTKMWAYCWRSFVDHSQGGWFRVLGRAGEKLDDIKCPHGKVDYHVVGMCLDAADALEAIRG
jgi:mannose/cellobiose epimerase-like protein (N-acyl-D-glucosamine 2-epimerase family)